MYGQFPSYGTYEDPDSAVCNIWPLEDGWRLQVELPEHLSDEQRVEILNWLTSYRAEIRQQHPHWLMRFSDNGHEYILDVVPADGPREAVQKVLPFIQSRQSMEADYE